MDSNHPIPIDPESRHLLGIVVPGRGMERNLFCSNLRIPSWRQLIVEGWKTSVKQSVKSSARTCVGENKMVEQWIIDVFSVIVLSAFSLACFQTLAS
jgi:hypothetical protein